MNRHIASALLLLLLISPITFRSAKASTNPSRRILILNEAFTVAAGNYRYWTFTVHRNGARIFGKFRAEGGRNDIEFLIMDEDGFENWRNGHGFKAYYRSGPMTVDTVNITVPPGQFFLVFSNRFSTITNKAVTATFYSEPL